MITKHQFKTDERLRELLPDGFDRFPCYCKYNDAWDYLGGTVSWHWHQAFEIDYVVNGHIRFQTTEVDEVLKPGDAVFVNSNMLHTLKVETQDEAARSYTFFFDPELLSGGYGTLFHDKFILPVLSDQKLQAFMIRPEQPEGLRMLNLLLGLIDLFRDEPFGYELGVRSTIGALWLMLLDSTETLRAGAGRSSMTDHVRMKQMISYMEEHYAEKITLADIASAAGIGGRECGRCFTRTVGISPVEYLTRYRIRQAARQITETADSIGAISDNCGFSSDSYFGKLFRETMGCSPREYRKKGLQQT